MAMVGAVLALLWLRHSKQQTILACLCIWPLIVLWNPPAVELMLRTVPSSVLYRLIYGSLYWIFLIVFFGLDIRSSYLTVIKLSLFSFEKS